MIPERTVDDKGAWSVWTTHVGKGGHISSVDEGLLLEQAEQVLFHPWKATPELWQAVA